MRALDGGEQGVHPLPRHGRSRDAARRPPTPRPARGRGRACRRRARRSCSTPRACASRHSPSISRLSRMPATSSAWAALSGSDRSRTCRTRSASRTSSSVARKAATSWVGRSEMKPTVSDMMTSWPCGRLHAAAASGRAWRTACPRASTPAPGEPVEQGRLARVRVADECDDGVRHLGSLGALQIARAAHRLQLALQAHDLVAQDAPVGLDLRLARPAEEARRAATLALQVGPRAHEAAALVVEMGQLDLQRALLGGGTAAEDLEDQPGAVEHLGLQFLLQVALLHGGERVVDDDHLRAGLGHRLGQLRNLAGAEQRRGARLGHGRDLGAADVEVDGAREPDSLLQPRLVGAAGARLPALEAQRQAWDDDHGRAGGGAVLDACPVPVPCPAGLVRIAQSPAFSSPSASCSASGCEGMMVEMACL